MSKTFSQDVKARVKLSRKLSAVEKANARKLESIRRLRSENSKARMKPRFGKWYAVDGKERPSEGESVLVWVASRLPSAHECWFEAVYRNCDFYPVSTRLHNPTPFQTCRVLFWMPGPLTPGL